jgi:hypothetical protein
MSLTISRVEELEFRESAIAWRDELPPAISGIDPGCRLESLRSSCESLVEGLGPLDLPMREYMSEVPLAAYESEHEDADRFLDWLAGHDDVGGEQRDFIARQRGRNAVDRVVLRRRLAHLRFQEMLSFNDSLPADLNSRSKQVAHLNPIHVWARYESHAVVSEATTLPATVVFFPTGEGVVSQIVDSDMIDVLRRLEHYGPMSVRELARAAARPQRDDLVAKIRDLAEAGLLALI